MLLLIIAAEDADMTAAAATAAPGEGGETGREGKEDFGFDNPAAVADMSFKR